MNRFPATSAIPLPVSREMFPIILTMSVNREKTNMDPGKVKNHRPISQKNRNFWVKENFVGPAIMK